MRSKGRKPLLVLAVIVAVPLVTWAIPPVRARYKAIAVLAEAAGLDIRRPLAAEIDVERVRLGENVRGDMYSPGHDAPAILFIPGAAPKGTHDPRVQRAATALARAGRRVFVPELDLYERVFHASDIERIREAVDALSSGGPVGVLGFSYGGSFSLVAAEDPETSQRLAFVATFGAYYDLLHVLQAVTTGATILDRERVRFRTVPQAREILRSAIVSRAPEEYDDVLAAAIAEQDPERLPPPVDAIRALLVNDDPRRTAALAADLPARFQALLGRFSPSTHVDSLDVPVFIMQSKKDEATPWTEAVLLHRAVDDSRLVMLEHFSHVDPPETWELLQDAPGAWRFVSWILTAQE